MNETTNYKLKKPAQNDYYNVEDFNENADIIDAALKKLQDKKASLDDEGKVPSDQLPSMNYIPTTQKGSAGGVATLGVDGKVPSSQLPNMSAANITYNNTDSGLTADNAQAAIDELQSKKAELSEDGKIDKSQLPDDIPTGETIGQPGGVASLDEDGKVPADQLPEINTSSAVLVTLTASGWTLSGDRYYQIVTVAGVTADTPVVLVDCALDGTDLDADAAVLEAWSNGPSGHNVSQGNGTVTFYSYYIPAVNIPVNVGVA